ncbi:hypothetical protein JOF50_000283 [Corynebacterium mucifaciens]|uniref:Uncharacterized protein n=1 Tax=Corynebacterium mucifaciens TaxID=57171 RepID=A0ABV2NV62_9CORY
MINSTAITASAAPAECFAMLTTQPARLHHHL